MPVRLEARSQVPRPLAWSVPVLAVLATAALSGAVFLGLLAGSVWAVEQVVARPSWLGWLAGLAGGVGAALLALWLFVPVALLIATLYMDRIAAAVDGRFYPGLPVPLGALNGTVTASPRRASGRVHRTLRGSSRSRFTRAPPG